MIEVRQRHRNSVRSRRDWRTPFPMTLLRGGRGVEAVRENIENTYTREDATVLSVVLLYTWRGAVVMLLEYTTNCFYYLTIIIKH